MNNNLQEQLQAKIEQLERDKKALQIEIQRLKRENKQLTFAFVQIFALVLALFFVIWKIQ